MIFSKIENFFSGDALHEPYEWSQSQWQALFSPLKPDQRYLCQLASRIAFFVPLILASLVSYPLLFLAKSIRACFSLPDFSSHHVIEVFPSSMKNNLKKIQIFLLGEVHHQDKTLEANKRLIAYFAKKEGAILFFEGVEKNTKVLDPIKITELKKRHHLEDVEDRRITVYGWDLMKDFDASEQIAHSIYNELLKSDNSIRGIEIKYTQKAFQSKAEIETDLSSVQTCLETVKKLNDRAAKITDSFPERTQAMTQTVQNIPNILHQEGQNKKIFFIAGEEHVRESRSDPRTSLSSLRNALQTLSQAAEPISSATLIPKSARKEYIEHGAKLLTFREFILLKGNELIKNLEELLKNPPYANP